VKAGPRPDAPAAAILLDTHTLLWLVTAPDQLAANVCEMLANPGRTLAVSAVSAWEIAIKTRLGRLDGEPLLSAWPDIMAAMAVTELAIEAADAILAARLYGHRVVVRRSL